MGELTVVHALVPTPVQEPPVTALDAQVRVLHKTLFIYINGL